MKLGDLQNGLFVEGDHGLPPHLKPNWLDKERFKRGQKFIMDNLFSNLLALHFSLVAGFSINNLLEPLIFTKQSGTPMKALKRYLQTFFYLMEWFRGDLWDDKNDSGYLSVRKVRKMHGDVAKKMNKNNAKKALFISQYDMAIVQCGFFSAVLKYHDRFGIKCSKEDLTDYIHFWRGIGYLLGISDEFNICSGSYEDVCQITDEIEAKILLPSLFKPSANYRTMAKAYCDGLNITRTNNLHTVEADTAVVLDTMGIGLHVPLGFWDSIRFYFWKTILFLNRWVPGVSSFMTKIAVSSFQDNYKKFA